MVAKLVQKVVTQVNIKKQVKLPINKLVIKGSFTYLNLFVT